MGAKGEAFELTGTVRMIADRRIVVFDQESSDRLPSRGQVAVELVFAGKTSTVVLDPDGRRGHWLSIDGSGPVDIEAESGSSLTFTAQLSDSWPETEVPMDLSAALKGTPELDGTWAGLTPMARWEWVRWVGATKNPQTRQRRVEVSISKLLDGKRRPCCFDLSSCTDPEVAKSGKLIG
ncbi:YdeI/OmpD-associated family protein [Glutamicibacter protophormiae]|uniref:YdeI/OmpD-associated family protein n=1 Tax=Glutamicibacter protophormiae TaxID=37930 RepID=UPI00195A9FC1|nr:YdeI/OmpD-associated family protein [Glutamicibacter protophormiae]QRQ78732.1 YdeI/OmpD-associated family protein [Glutamicibacter protophormiae]